MIGPIYLGGVRPRQQLCTLCCRYISTNALARAAHERGHQHQAAELAEMTRASRAERRRRRAGGRRWS